MSLTEVLTRKTYPEIAPEFSLTNPITSYSTTEHRCTGCPCQAGRRPGPSQPPRPSQALLHSFIHLTITRWARSQGRFAGPPPQSRNTLSRQARPGAGPGALRIPRTLSPHLSAARSAPVTRVPAAGLGPHRSAHAPRPASPGSRASAPIRRVRPAGFVERRSARPWRHPTPGFSDPPRARRPDPGAWEGGSGPPATHLLRVRSEGPVLSRLKPLRPPHTPQCPRCLLVLDRPPIALLLVHLKGLWARAARSLKEAVRSSVSWGVLSLLSPVERRRVTGAKAADHPAKKRKKAHFSITPSNTGSSRILTTEAPAPPKRKEAEARDRDLIRGSVGATGGKNTEKGKISEFLAFCILENKVSTLCSLELTSAWSLHSDPSLGCLDLF
ncbi:uncharacterized protein LOC118713059 [Pipistrellus kuhlii]|uniref:uncharacterized protein LOC118713059 n=1 Tax=Pipistrellus kuhlii TaxID=59472 RepID=UPI00174F18FB|nr:uncharacterized protein LOC118713059 [Pipistrellus kuhlii]